MATLNIKRFPDSLYEALHSRAEREHRSVSQEVIYLLKQAVSEPEPISILQLRGLGKEIWRGVDVSDYIDKERDSWD